MTHRVEVVSRKMLVWVLLIASSYLQHTNGAEGQFEMEFRVVKEGVPLGQSLHTFSYSKDEDRTIDEAIHAWVAARGIERNRKFIYSMKQMVHLQASDERFFPYATITARLSESVSFRVNYHRADDILEVLEPFRIQYGLDMSDVDYLRTLLQLQVKSEFRPLPLDVLLPSYSARLDSVATAHTRAAERAFLTDALSPGLPLQNKVTEHAYEYVYAKYLYPLRGQAFRLLEIGLGGEPVGASALMWRRLFSQADVYAAEYSTAFRDAFLSQHPRSGVRVLLGDQSDESDLRRWIREMGAPADVIIDDGGHSNKQQLTSLMVLFNEGLRPGGIYVIEDLQVAYFPEAEDLGGVNQTTGVLAGIMEAHVLGEGDGHQFPGRLPGRLRGLAAHWRLEGLKSIDCFPEACVLVKCAGSDRCS